MVLFRVTQKEFANLDGIGGLLVAGRWNEKGHRALNLAENRALAMLEYLVNVGGYDLLPKEIVLLTVEVPKGYQNVTENDLPSNWKNSPKVTRKTGTDFLINKSGLLLRVPSIHVPNEYNFLMNPAHEDSRSCKIKSIDSIKIDPRFFNIP